MRYIIPLVDGVYNEGDASITTEGTRNESSSHKIIVALNGAPSDGKLTIQYKRAGSNRWDYVDYTNLSEVEPQKIEISGVSSQFRFIVEGASGTGTAIISDTEHGEALTPYGLFDATGGMTPAEVGGALKSINPLASLRNILTSGSSVQLFGNSIVEPNYSYMNIASVLSGGGFSVVRNSAVPGFTSEEILEKIISEGFHPSADAVVFQEGTNDAAQGVSVSEHISNFKEIVYLIRSAGKIPVVILTSPVRDKAFSDELLNMWIAEAVFCRNSMVPFIDPWTELTDVDGDWIASSTTDDTHPTVSAQHEAGANVVSVSDGSVVKIIPRSNDNPVGILGGNALLIDDSNADGIPDGWIANNFSGATFAISPAIRGNKCTVTLSGQTAQCNFFRQTSTGFSEGDEILFTGFVSANSVSDARVVVYVFANGAGEYFYSGSLAGDADESYFDRTFTVPSGTTHLQVYVQITPDGTGNGSFSFSGLGLYNMRQLSEL